MDETGGTVNAIASLDGHSKVIMLDYDTAMVYIDNLFTSKTSGTVEYWIYTDSSAVNNIKIRSGTDVGPYVSFRAGDIKTYDGAWHTVGTYSDNTWYHVKEVITAGGTNEFDLYVNGVLLDSGRGFHPDNPNSFDNLYIQTSADSICYIDAIGYSWDPNYSVGDNASAYSQVVYRQAKARRGSHESHRDFSAFDITKMIFPEVI